VKRFAVAVVILAAAIATATMGPAVAAPVPTKPLNLYAGTKPETAAMGTVTEPPRARGAGRSVMSIAR